MTEPEPPGMLSFAIGEYTTEDTSDLPEVEAELARVQKVFGLFGIADEPWDVAMSGRGYTAVTDRLGDWRHSDDGRDTVLYWIGHGELTKYGARLLTRDASNGIRPHDFAEALSDRAHAGPEPSWTFVVVDTCHSKAFVEQTSSLLRAAKGQHHVLLFGVSGAGTTRLGEFGTALEQAVGTDFRGRAVIPLQELAARLRELLHGSDFSEPSGLTPRARLVRRDPWLSVRGPLDMLDGLDAALRRLDPDRIREFTENVRQARDAQYGDVTWHFTGRRAERRRVVGWLRESTEGMLVVTGEPGAGKSAFLGYLLAQSQPALRTVLDTLGLVIEADERSRPPDDVFTAALSLRNLSTATTVTAIADACRLGAPRSPRDLRQPAQWLIRRVRDSGRPLTLLLDGLDEAHDPPAIADAVLRELAALPGVRLLVGTRPSTAPEGGANALSNGSDTDTESGPDILEALGIESPPEGDGGPVDGPGPVTLTAEPDDVVIHVLDRLNTALGERLPASARTQIRNMIEPDNWGFLFARLAVHEILARPHVLDDVDEMQRLLGGADPRRLFGAAVDRLRSAAPSHGWMLRALAYAQGSGLPLTGDIWATVVEALSGEPAPAHAEFEELTRTASPYISLDDDNGLTVYRLAHHTFQEHFLAADGEAAVREGHGRIVRALLGGVPTRSVEPLHPYLSRYLSGHAAAAGMDGWRDLAARTDVLDRLDARTLGTDAVRSALGSADAPEEITGVIGARHRLVNAGPRDRRGIREMAMAQQAGTTEFPAPPSPHTGTAAWTVHRAWLRRQDPHTTLDGRGHMGLNALTAYTGRHGTDLLAAGGADGTVRVWSPTGERVHLLPGPRGREVRAVLALPGRGGRTLLAAGGSGNTIRLWRVRGQGADVLPPLEHPGGVRSMTTLAEGERVLLATGGDDGVVRLWDPADGEPTRVLRTASEPQRSHGSRYRNRPGAERRHWVRAMTTYTEAAPPGRKPRTLLVTASQDGGIRVWDPSAESADPAPVSGWSAHHGRISVVRGFVGPGGRPLLASCGEDRSVRIWDPATGRQVLPELTGHTRWVNDLAVFTGPDGRPMLASAGDDGTLLLWNPFTGDRIGEPWTTGHTKGIRALHVFTGPGQRTMLATAGQDGRVKTWDPAAGPAFKEDSTLRHSRSVHAVTTYRRQDSRVSFATVSSDRTARLWDAALSRPSGTLLHSRPVRAVTALQAGGRAQLLATGGNDGRIWIWDPADSRRVGDPLIAGSRLTALVSFPGPGKKKVLVAGAYGRRIRLWDPVARTTFGREFVAHDKNVLAMAWFPEPETKRVMLVTTGADRTLRVWDAHHRSEARDPVALPSGALSLSAFEVDGRWLLAVGGRDRTIRVMDPATGVQEQVLTGHSQPVTAIAWARTGPDGPKLISGSWDRELRVWDPLGAAAPLVVPVGVAVHGLAVADGRVAVACSEGLVIINLPAIRPVH